jgi:hypothetical protein
MEMKYNNWPANSKLSVKPLPKGEMAIYRLLNTFNPKTKQYSLRTQLIPSTSTVVDPETNELYEAAYVRFWRPDGSAELGNIWFEPGNMCLVHIRGGNPDDQKKYQFLEVSNHNLSNPNRDVTQEALFERVTAESDAQAERKLRQERMDALAVVNGMSDEDIVAFFRSQNMPSAGSKADQRNRIEALAEENPKLFLKGTTVGMGDILLEIENLIKYDVIRYDREQAVWTASDGKIVLKLQRSFNSDPKAELAKHLQRYPNKRDDLQTKLDKFQASRLKPEKPKLPKPDEE